MILSLILTTTKASGAFLQELSGYGHQAIRLTLKNQ